MPLSCLKMKARKSYRRLGWRSRSDLSEEKEAAAGDQKKAAAVVVSSHPMQKSFWSSSKKAAAAKPEFLRYLQYMTEAGSWDPSSDKPVIFFK